ncbi:Abi family protein [Austwickia sp. TVS 96-490-7B]|uniref:Abi family protein n=1 Tax=Austwickia sp. TVS 96-490-7B TaxID=2830843 RepID=UPI001C5939D2|nr:Abi family protein [Austwickia sp. TVS 96-490-7B]
MTAPYRKPHLSVSGQVCLLRQRGLVVVDVVAAERLLGAVGYYRLSAYTYPYREFLPPGTQPESRTQFRADTIRAGTTFEQVAALYEFDLRLRRLCLAATGTVEVGLRTRVADVLGARDPFGHAHIEALDPTACRTTIRGGRTRFDAWQSRSEQLLRQARNEDFVAHFKHKYDPPPPVWVACETWDFGALSRVMGLLRKGDAITVARSVGVENGSLLVHIAEGLNIVRNISAHHGRLWNRTLTQSMRRFQPDDVPHELRHLTSIRARGSVYPWLTWLAYLSKSFNPTVTFPSEVRALVETLQSLTGFAPVVDMGFPKTWRQEQIWRPGT